MILQIDDEHGFLGTRGESLLRLCADAAEHTEGLRLQTVAYVRIVDDEQIRVINREQRGKDVATDVLSFPTVNYPPGATAATCEDSLKQQYDPDEDACMLGDILISKDHVCAQAEIYGHSVRREASYLLTHGLFHLMGYDHMTDADRMKMRAMEEKALESIGMTREKEEV